MLQNIRQLMVEQRTTSFILCSLNMASLFLPGSCVSSKSYPN
ncbi:hypothetical protein PO522_22725 [Escherichia coli]|nr:hypothetical protein [Escherichia coli]MCV8052979.1 hypothetical protein [Escherichia coli]MCZ5657320.1 hypothetical protein [Escherichia coli]MDF9105209.1 hypothetical protein [Escherichia coli]MDM8898633.1 hypothetical protein [Escherichia coli]WJW25980.1 hypothetical protein QVM97_26505 [Escherichia coli]